MAKQSGLHQIKGKIGEYSYYKQTGVNGGLIRGINQGMSARVKTGAEYANTRLNNQEFGAAANTAALLGQMVTPKFRPMILPFSQSKMAKEILKLARQNSSAWGQRTIANDQAAQVAAVLTAQSKLNFDLFAVGSIAYDSGDDFSVTLGYDAEQSNYFTGLGIDGLTINAYAYDMATGKYNLIAHEMSTGFVNRVDSAYYQGDGIVAGDANTSDETLTIPAFVPPANHGGFQIIVLVCLPTRSVDGVNHILQEYCSFKAIVVPARS